MFKENIHYSTELEKIVLGACMLEKNAVGRIYGLIEADMWYYDGHRAVFKTIVDLWGSNEPTDILSVYLKLNKEGVLYIENYNTAYYVTRLLSYVVSTASLEYHALKMRDFYIQREMIKLTTSGIQDLGPNTMEEMSTKLNKLREKISKDSFLGIDEVLVNLYKHMDQAKEKDLSGITTGFARLNSLTGGFQRGGMYIIGARPSVGKSAFMGRMVYEAAKQGHSVGIISLEMTDNQIAARISSLVTDIEYWRIYRSRLVDENQAKLFYQKTQELSELPIVISDETGVDIGEVKSKVAKLKNKNKIDILFIDYLQLLDTDERDKNSNREQQVSKMSRGIKLLAKDYDIPIVVLAQLNRVSEGTADKKPKLHNLRESGSLEQDSDGVIFLHRDWMSGLKVNEMGASTENEADIIIAKWRDGETTEYKIGFDGSKMKFYELEERAF
jgi:replicative DNA helicase